jgi:glycosyltransferase involved in cell wall biosynthesis
VPDEPVRVVVDGLALSDGSRRRGFGTTLAHLLPGLAAVPSLDVVVLARPGAEVPPGASIEPLARHDVRAKLALLEHEWRLPRDLRRARPQVVWSPANHPPRRCPAPLVQTVHDLTPLVLPSPETAHDARRWRRRAGRVRDAARVVTVSRSSADQAMRLLGVDAARIEVVPNGVDPQYTPGAADGESAPYLAFVAAWGPHKGHAEAFATVAALADLGYPHVLRVAGPNDEWMRARVDDVLARADRPDRVEILDYVDDLADLYRGASALLFTSRAEGFGLPIVEAMACRTPVVAFDNTSIPEVAGDAGVLVPDGDLDQYVHAVRRVLDDAAFAADRRAAGLEQAARFRWDDAVARYGEIFVDVGSA